MTAARRPLRWGEIEAYLAEVGAELERRQLERTIIVVGGAYVAYHGVRTATIDVDTIDELDDELCSVIAMIAARHGLEHDWLNDRARPWRPATFDPATCDVALVTGGLRVLLPTADVVVLMKIAAGGGRTPNDTIDLRALWPTSGFTTPAEAVAAFCAAYPHEEPDPHLADWIASVLNAD